MVGENTTSEDVTKGFSLLLYHWLVIALAEISKKPWFLWVAFGVPAGITILQFVAPYEPTFKAQNIAVWFGIAGGIVVSVLWLSYKGVGKSSRVFQILLTLIVLTWLYQSVLQLQDGYSFNHTTYFLPLLMILIFLKPPTRDQIWVAGLVLGYSLATIMLFSLFSGGHFGIPSGFDVSDRGPSRFPIISDIFGIELRWGGAFGSVNLVTPAGALIVMLGTLYGKWHRITFLSTGIVVLFLGQARTAYFALGFALLVLLVWSKWLNRVRFSAFIKWVLMGAAFVSAVSYIYIFDPSLALRVPVWRDYLGILQDSFLRGAGSSGVDLYVSEMAVTESGRMIHNHGHSIYVDGLVRYGIVWFLLTLSIFAVAALIAWKARHGPLSSRGMAIVLFVFFAGLTETIFSWAYVTIYLLALILVAGLSTCAVTESDLSGSEENTRL